MSAQHTPGPWRLAENDSTIVVTEALDEFGDCYVVADVMMRIPADESDEANARLIAAAPELLEALVALLVEDEPTMAQLSARFRNGRAAIAKATP